MKTARLQDSSLEDIGESSRRHKSLNGQYGTKHAVCYTKPDCTLNEQNTKSKTINTIWTWETYVQTIIEYEDPVFIDHMYKRSTMGENITLLPVVANLFTV